MAAIIERDIEAETEVLALTHKKILRFYLPLAMSWIFMSVEGPTCTAILGRLPSKELNTAAFQVLMGMALWLESPIIDLLSTSTTLCKSRQNYAQLSKFVWYLLAWVTIGHFLVVCTPLYWAVTLDTLQLPVRVAETARPALIVMLPWSPLIGWRRYLQGILIRSDKTRLVGIGTFIRVATMSVVGWTLYATSSTTNLPGTLITAVSLICAVGAEAVFAHIASRPVVRSNFKSEILQDDEPASNPPLTMKKLLAFHLPLSATTMVMFASSLVISSALSRTSGDKAELSLASWQVAGTLVWLCRTIVFALPEVIITLYKDKASAAKLRDFSIRVGLITSGAMAAVGILGLDRSFFRVVLGENPPTVAMAHLAFMATMAIPMIGALQSYVRGMLTAHHMTVARFVSVLVNILTMTIMLSIGIRLHWMGVLNAAIAATVSMVAELTVLYWSLMRAKVAKLEVLPGRLV